MNFERNDHASERPLDLIVRLLRDWWRGYSDCDIWMAEQKMHGPFYQGQITFFSEREWKAYRAMQRKQPNGVFRRAGTGAE